LSLNAWQLVRLYFGELSYQIEDVMSQNTVVICKCTFHLLCHKGRDAKCTNHETIM